MTQPSGIGPEQLVEPAAEVSESPTKRRAQLDRQRAALLVLRDEPAGLHKDEVYRRTVQMIPLLPDESGVVKTGNRDAAQVTFEFQSSVLALAGWLLKWSGEWRITPAGRTALELYADSESLWGEANAIPDRLGVHTPDSPPTPEDLASRIVGPVDNFRVRRLGPKMLRNSLATGASNLETALHTWGPDTVDDLFRRYNEQPDDGNRKFLDKLKEQLAGAPDGTIYLAAELVALYQLPLSNLTPTTKTDRMRRILHWASTAVTPSTEMSYAFYQGSWHGGTGGNTQMWKGLADLVAFLQRWWLRPEAERQAALADPWLWRDIVEEPDGPLSMPSTRDSLKYLAFPETFQPIVSREHKKAIVAAFGDELDEPLSGDVDRDLLRISTILQTQSQGRADFYLPPLREAWQQTPAIKRAWFVRGSSVSGQNLVPQWVSGNFVSLPATNLEVLAPPYPRNTTSTAVGAAYAGRPADYRRQKTADYDRFLRVMSAGDLVITDAEGRVHVGTIEGEPEWSVEDSIPARLRRAVSWTEDYAFAELPGQLPSRLSAQEDVVDLTEDLTTIEALVSDLDPEDFLEEEQDVLDEPKSPSATLVAPTEGLVKEVHLPLAWLARFTRTLERRQQAILYGPPGTGKTYLAQALAEHWADKANVTLVQFHPSVAYEDFIAGYRPTEKDGNVVFELRQGPFMKLAERARDDLGRPYVLIIDEINRANLAKVFGELYFLLEYRDKPITPLYSEEGERPFTLPPNIFIIGTMNTADRSIALVDAAMRRRFAFIEMHPDEDPVKDVLRRWLVANEHPMDAADLLDELNDRIDGKDFAIGPSYFMKDWIYEEQDGMNEVWETDLLPLLEEHHAGEGYNVPGRYGLEALRQALAAQPSRQPTESAPRPETPSE